MVNNVWFPMNWEPCQPCLGTIHFQTHLYGYSTCQHGALLMFTPQWLAVTQKILGFWAESCPVDMVLNQQKLGSGYGIKPTIIEV